MEDSHSPEEQTEVTSSPEEQTEGTSSPEEQSGGTFSLVFIQNDDHDTISGDEEASEAPRKFRSMVDIMERAPRHQHIQGEHEERIRDGGSWIVELLSWKGSNSRPWRHISFTRKVCKQTCRQVWDARQQECKQPTYTTRKMS
ncbi:hypothetical protein Bca4012_029666 [Brassica carinata]